MRQVFLQPNGRLAVFSEIVDDFILWDATEEEYVAFLVMEESEKIKKSVRKIVEKLHSVEQPVKQIDFQRALDTIRRVHGEERYDEIRIELGIHGEAK